MDRLLLILPSATYRAADFMTAAREMGVAITVASERRATMSETMGDRALTLRLSDPQDAAETIIARARDTPFAAIVGVDDQGVMAAALASEHLGLAHNPPAAVARTRDKAAMRQALARAGWDVDDVDLFEVNEAFAAVVLRFLQAFDVDPGKVNVNGGAIAMGHPLGATGAMILGTALDELERTGKGVALITLCIGGGMGTATIIERV